MTDLTDGCPARLSFPTAPHLDVQCTEPPDHYPATLHKARAEVAAMTEPYADWAARPRSATFDGRTRATVYMTWAQNLPST